MATRFGALLALLATILATPVFAAETVTVLTTGNGTPVDWPLLIAMRKGMFAADGITVETIGVPLSGAGVQQVTAGSADIAVGGITDPIRAIDHGGAIVLLRFEAAVPPYSLWGKAAVKNLADLRGRTVIVGGAKDITRIYFERMADPNGLKPGDYDLVYAGTTAARYAALMAGSVDAAILYPPASFKARAMGFRDLGNLSTYVHDLPFSAFAANRGWATRNPAAVLGFVKGIDQAVVWFDDPANRTEAIDILHKVTGADQADCESTYDYFRQIDIFPVNGVVLPQTLNGLVQALAATGDLEGPADPGRFIDPKLNAAIADLK
jgi:ABC-type nitrate/sulfonate/bicarbonate transport system substrate-binding protein